MIETPMDVLQQYPVRKSRKQRQAFRDAVQAYAEKFDCAVTTEQGSGGCRNLIIGDPESALYWVTAHYDTPARLWGPNLTMPCNAMMFALCQILNAAVLMLPAMLIWAGVFWKTGNLLYAHGSLLAAVLVSVLLIFCGPANRHNANNNTSGVVTLLEILSSMPPRMRSKVCFVLFDKEEMGQSGSENFCKAHKGLVGKKTVLNLNCVGDGDTLMLFPSEQMKSDPWLRSLERSLGRKQIRIAAGKFCEISWDHHSYPRSISVMALHHGKLGYWLGRTHTRRDKILDQTNINILRACLISYIGSHTAE